MFLVSYQSSSCVLSNGILYFSDLRLIMLQSSCDDGDNTYAIMLLNISLNIMVGLSQFGSDATPLYDTETEPLVLYGTDSRSLICS